MLTIKRTPDGRVILAFGKTERDISVISFSKYRVHMYSYHMNFRTWSK